MGKKRGGGGKPPQIGVGKGGIWGRGLGEGNGGGGEKEEMEREEGEKQWGKNMRK